MHIIWEGIACNILVLFLHRCIIEYQFFTLNWLNNEIQNYPYGKGDKGHIHELITTKQLVLDVHVKQKAVAMLTLLFTLPHILVKVFRLEKQHYKHLACFIQITQLCFSPYSES